MKFRNVLCLLALVFASCTTPPAPLTPPPPNRLPEKPVVYVVTGFYCPFCWVAERDIRELKEVATVERLYSLRDKELIERFEIEKIPTFIVVDENDQEVYRAVGRNGAQEVHEFIDAN